VPSGRTQLDATNGEDTQMPPTPLRLLSKPTALLLLGVLLVLPIGWIARSDPRAGPSKLPGSFLDEMSVTNARFAAELDTEQQGIEDDSVRKRIYREWRKSYDTAVREVYQKHDKGLPPHLRGSGESH
jgi:hypothetical protein